MNLMFSHMSVNFLDLSLVGDRDTFSVITLYLVNHPQATNASSCHPKHAIEAMPREEYLGILKRASSKQEIFYSKLQNLNIRLQQRGYKRMDPR